MASTGKGAVSGILRELPLILAVSVGAGLAHLGTSTMPFQIGAVMDGAGMSAAQSGLFGFCEVASLALAMIVISNWVDRIAPVAVALCSCALIAAANLGAFLIHGEAALLLFGALAGAGYGCIFAASVAAAAAARDPDRLYGVGNGAALLIIVALMMALPTVSRRLGPLGVFAGLAFVPVLCAPLFLGLKRAAVVEETRLAAWRTPGAPGLLFSWAMFSMGTAALYAFSERIGHSIGLRAQDIATVLSAGTFIGLLGSLTAAVLGRRMNRRLALVVGMGASGLSCLLLGYSSNLLTYAAGVAAYWVFYMFIYSYLLGTAAMLDDSGRVGALGGGAERLGYAAGAWAGGVLAQHLSFSSTGALGFIGCVAGAAIGLPSVFRALQNRPPAPVESPLPVTAP